MIWLLIGLLAVVILDLSSPGIVSLVHIMTQRLTGKFSEFENQAILSAAEFFSIDPRFLAALRIAEAGGPGREFGVLSVSAPTYHDQADAAARTIAHTIRRYETATGQVAMGADGRYTREFIQYFSQGGPGYPGYAPIGAQNDPGGLNYNHFLNLLAAYVGTDIAAV